MLISALSAAPEDKLPDSHARSNLSLSRLLLDQAHLFVGSSCSPGIFLLKPIPDSATNKTIRIRHLNMAAASPAASTRRSPGSSAGSLRPSSDHLAISVDTLVNHLLVSKRSLSSMTLVLRADEIVTAARQSHEDTVMLAAQTGFLRNGIADQVLILGRVGKSLQATCEWGKKDFVRLVRRMDEVDGQLKATMDMLRGTPVETTLRPQGEAGRSLLDFVDEGSVHGMRNAMKQCIEELQVGGLS